MRTIRPTPCAAAVACLAALGLLAACRAPQPAPSDEAGVRDTLASLSRQFSTAYMAGDVEAVMELYADDAVLLPSSAEPIGGREAVRRYWTLPEGRVITHHQMTPVEVRVSGSMASDYGSYAISGRDGDRSWGPVHGTYLVVWQRGADGRWRMYLDMWNRRPAGEE